MSHRDRSALIRVSLAWCWAASLFLAASAWAETIALGANSTRVARVTSAAPAGSLSFHVDAKAQTAFIDILWGDGTLQTSLILPGGVPVDENSVAALGGSFVKANGADASAGPGIYPFSGGKWHYFYRVPITTAGNLQVLYAAPSASAQGDALAVQVQTDSTIAARLFFTESTAVATRPVVLAAVLFDGAIAVTGATAIAKVITPKGNVTNVVLRDDGVVADGAAGDGIYSGVYKPLEHGTYQAVVELTGVNAGASYVRQAATELEVVRNTATLTGSVQGRGVDLNGNGALEQIAVDVGVNAAVSGTYRVFVVLRGNDRQLPGSGDATLSAGQGQVTASSAPRICSVPAWAKAPIRSSG